MPQKYGTCHSLNSLSAATINPLLNITQAPSKISKIIFCFIFSVAPHKRLNRQKLRFLARTSSSHRRLPQTSFVAYCLITFCISAISVTFLWLSIFSLPLFVHYPSRYSSVCIFVFAVGTYFVDSISVCAYFLLVYLPMNIAFYLPVCIFVIET